MLIPKESDQLTNVTTTTDAENNETNHGNDAAPATTTPPLTNGSLNGDLRPAPLTKHMNILQNIIIKKEEHDHCIQIPIKREIDEDTLHNRIKIPRREPCENTLAVTRIKEEVLDIKSEVAETTNAQQSKTEVRTCFRCNMIFMDAGAYNTHVEHCGRNDDPSGSNDNTNYLQRLEQLPRLIENVRSTPCLYNTDIDGYNNVELKDGVWNEIAGNCEFLSGKIAKATWKKLLQEFCDSLNKRQTDDTLEPYRYEQQMQFMLPYIENLMSTYATNYSLLQNYTNVSEVIDEEDDDTQLTTPPPAKRQRISTTPIMPQQPAPPGNSGGRALDLFFMSMCEGTKDLPYNLQLQVKKKVFDAVLEAESILNRVSHIRNERFTPPCTPGNDFAD